MLSKYMKQSLMMKVSIKLNANVNLSRRLQESVFTTECDFDSYGSGIWGVPPIATDDDELFGVKTLKYVKLID